MINRTKPSKYTLKQLGIRLFLAQSSNPKSFQILLLLTEFILFTYFVSSKYADPLTLTEFVDYNVLIGFSVAFITARLLFGLTLVRILYLPCIFVINDNQNLIIYTAIISITLLVNLLTEITSRIQFQFVSHNPYSQSLNVAKIFHYIIMIFSTYLRVNSLQVIDKKLQWIPDLILLVLFIVIFIIKLASQTVSKFVKQVFLRFYLLCIVYYVRDLSANWINQLKQSYIDFIVIFISQTLYFFMVLYQKRKEVKNQISNRSVVGSIFSILAYHFNENYDETLQKMQNELFFSQPQSIMNPHQQTLGEVKVRTSINTHNMSMLNYKILQMHTNRSFVNTKKLNSKQKSRKNKSNNLSQLRINKDISKKISQKCLQLLKQAYEQKNDNLYNCKFLIIQIKFYLEGNFLVAKKFVDDLEVHCSKFSFIKRICLYKLKKKIEKSIIDMSITKCELNYQQFFSNQNLRNQIIKNSLQYLQLWNYMVNQDFLFEKITKLLNKVLKRQKYIEQIYKKIRVKCQNIIILYSNYMYMVRRDVQQTLQLSRNLQIFRESLTELNISNKIYISVMLQKQNQLCFENVGYNIKLLGYSKPEIKKSKASILLPSFFAAYHEQLMIQDLNHNNQGLVVYNKNTYVKHYQGFFLPVLLNLRIFYNKQGNLISEGYIQIQQDFRYNWKNYFILKQSEEQIIEIGPTLQQHLILPSNKFHHVGDYFQANVGDKSRQRYYYSEEGFYQYVPVKSFWVKDQRYQLCVEDNFSDGRSFQTITTNNDNYTQKYETMKYQKFAVNYQDHSTNLSEYFKLKNETILKITKKTPIIIFIIVLFLFFICIGLVGFLVKRVEVVNQSSLSIIADLDNLLEFYHNLQNFGINLMKVLFESFNNKSFYYGYYTHQEICLKLQQKNTLLAKFDSKIYGYVRPQANFQPKSLNILISDMVANCFASLYIRDMKILSQNFRNLHILYEFVWSSTVDDYLKVCLQSAIQVTDIDNVYKLALGIFIGIAILAIYILMIKIRNIDRQFQFYILDIFSYVNANFIFINSINSFLRMTINCIPDSEVQFENKKHYRRNSVAGCNTSRMQLVSSVSAREISVKEISGKQNSARGLFQQSALYKNVNRNPIITKNRSIPQNTIELQEKIQQNEEQRKQKKTSPHSKLYLFLWTLVSLLTLSVLVSNVIINQSQSKIGISKSLKSLLILLNKQLVFSSTVICYLDSVGSNGNFSMFKTNYDRFDTLEKDMATFDQVNLPQFNKFASMLKNFNFVYLCDYIGCSQKNSKQFNISYGSAIEKFNNFMINNMGIKMTDKKFDQNFQLLFDAHYLLQNTFYQLIKTYLQNYKTFETNKLKILLLFYYCQFIVFFVFLSSALVHYCCFFVRNREKYLQVLNLIKQDSYNMHILKQHEAE